MNKGVWLGAEYLEEGEYTINGGLGNKVLVEMKVENNVLYTRYNENEEWVIKEIPPINYFKMPEELQLPKKKKKGMLEKFFG